MPDCVVIHYGEIAIKGKNRPFFERTLLENIREALKDCAYEKLKKISGRFILALKDTSDAKAIVTKLKKVFGISYFALAHEARQDIGDIKMVAAKVVEDSSAKTVRVLTKRSNKQFPLQSPEINRIIGEHLISLKGFTVDMVDATLSVWIEIVEKYVFIYTERVNGLGGLPVGVSGKVLALISGGIDSPVAAYLMMKRGCSVKFIHFFNDAINSRGALEKLHDLVKVLVPYNKNTKLYVIPFKDIQFEIIKYVPSKYRMLVYRRMMFTIAEKIARREEAKALVTGDNVAQVGSQTIENMGIIRQAAEMLVLSPLLSFDKQEIVNLAQKIGTYDVSILPYEDCCSYYIAKHPALRATIEVIEKFENHLNRTSLCATAISKREISTFEQ